MSLSGHKITSTEISTKGVVAAPDILTGTATENKQVFDRLIREAVADDVNGLIDALEAATSPTGASQIGASVTGVTGATVEAILTALKTLVDDKVAISETEYTEEQKTQIRSNIGVSGSQVAVTSVNGHTGAVVIYTDLTDTLDAGETTLIFTNAKITTTCTYEIYTDAYGVAPKTAVAAAGTLTMTFKVRTADLGVKLRIYS